MPAVKMVAKTPTTCKKDGRYPHVSQKSNTISKRPCSMVGVTDAMEDLDISCQTYLNGGFSVNKEYSKEHDYDEHQMSCDEETILGKNSLPFNGCADSLVETVRLTFISWILFV